MEEGTRRETVRRGAEEGGRPIFYELSLCV